MAWRSGGVGGQRTTTEAVGAFVAGAASAAVVALGLFRIRKTEAEIGTIDSTPPPAGDPVRAAPPSRIVVPGAVYAFAAAGGVRLAAERFYGTIGVTYDELGVSPWHLFTNAAAGASLAIVVVFLILGFPIVVCELTWKSVRTRPLPVRLSFAVFLTVAATVAGFAVGFGMLWLAAENLPPSIADQVLLLAGALVAFGVVHLASRGAEVAQSPAIFFALTIIVMWWGGFAGASRASEVLLGESPADDLGVLAASLAVAPTATPVCVAAPGGALRPRIYLGGTNGTVLLLHSDGTTVTRAPADEVMMTSRRSDDCG